ncbi:chloride channel [Lineolata rhizophorae]|uniref:Chloride channel protein n=1 Tax=Lineolata rhizophorae TaxID=578093 RepID=A0A6A6PAP6_9PEZI|nr:chloride channel [Lineolata rhizophorae]
MPPDPESATERTRLLESRPSVANDPHLRELQHDEEARSIVNSAVSKSEQELKESSVGERLPYNDYTTIDWLHDLVKDSYRYRNVRALKGIRGRLASALNSCSGWFAVALIGSLTACVAFVVDVGVATISDYKLGHCRRNPFLSREACCEDKTPMLASSDDTGASCPDFTFWSNNYWATFAIYVGFALAYGIISSSATMLTRRSLPAAPSPPKNMSQKINGGGDPMASGKVMYMAAGSGIPEIKTILSGFVIPNFLDLKVLLVKAFGSIFAVSTGMCLGKEGPFVHISTCVGYLVGKFIPKYRDNGRKMRQLLSAACAAGLSVAFGAPIGGVLFSYEEISTYFPRRVLWRAFLCSLFAAVVLKALNPTGTGKLVLFETNYGTSYEAIHYLVFVVLGIAGGIFGGIFCRANFAWSRWFRAFPLIKNYPVLEAFLVVLATTLLQFPNPLTREPGDVIIKNLLVDCESTGSKTAWVCQQEGKGGVSHGYLGWLFYGTVVKLLLTIITFGVKVPSGVIIPALDGGAFFGRLIGQWIPGISPGIFAMVGAGAFLAGVSRMTISLGVIMFELTGELEYIVPDMIAILVAKWVADAIGEESVYDLAQAVLGHPFLDLDHAMLRVQNHNTRVEALIPPPQTMEEITVAVPPSNKVRRSLLAQKLALLQRRGLMDAGLVLVQNGLLQGYIGQGELDFGLTEVGAVYDSGNGGGDGDDADVRLLGDADEGDFDLGMFVDRTPLCVCAAAPMEYAVEMFGKLGLRYLMVTEEGTGKLVGVIIKKRLVAYLDSLGH